MDSYRQAWNVLHLNFKEIKNGVIVPKVKGYKPTKVEWAAILFLEWDFIYYDDETQVPGVKHA